MVVVLVASASVSGLLLASKFQAVVVVVVVVVLPCYLLAPRARTGRLPHCRARHRQTLLAAAASPSTTPALSRWSL